MFFENHALSVAGSAWHMMSSPLFRSLVALVGILLAITPASALQKLKVGVLPISESLPAILADKQGFFAAEGLQVEFTKFDSGAIALPILQSGRLNIVLSSTISTLEAIEQGLDVKILAPGAVVRETSPDATAALVVRKGFLKSIKDLEGKRIAANVINSSAWLHAVAALEKRGLDRSKLRFVEVPFPQMNDPLLNGQVDAILQVDPFRYALLQSGRAEVVSWVYPEAAPGADITQYIALTPWVEKNRDIVAKFVRALGKGIQFAISNETALREANVQFTNLTPSLKDKVQLPKFGTAVNASGLAHTMDMMRKYGLLSKQVDVSPHIFRITP
jgi:NitT/TauT family transport system substrate-binding protein